MKHRRGVCCHAVIDGEIKDSVEEELTKNSTQVAIGEKEWEDNFNECYEDDCFAELLLGIKIIMQLKFSEM